MALVGDDKRDLVVGALSEQDGSLRQFQTLLKKEEDSQRKGDEAITITDTACKP